MLLEQLVAYAQRLEQSSGDKPKVPFMYQEQPVRWLVYLDKEGNFQRLQQTSDGSGKKNDRGKRFLTPHVMRSSGSKAKLLADNAEYALGIAREGANASKVAERHKLFIDELTHCAEVTKSSDIEAVLHYLNNILPGNKPDLPEDFVAEDVVSFSVEGNFPFDEPEAQHYWAGKFANTPESTNDDSFQAECLISGVVGPVMEREPVKIKGIPDGQTSGMNFISANAAAFESYGLSASQIAPVRLELAEKYANALNVLLRDATTSLRIGKVVYIFWTKNKGLPPVVEDLKEPKKSSMLAKWQQRRNEPAKVSTSSEQVKGQLKSVYSGNLYEGLEADTFYCASLSASGSRVVVRDHLTTTVGAIGERLAFYFQAQKLLDAEPFGIYELAACLYRDANKEMIPNVPTAILRFALHGTPLPLNFLANLVARNRAEQRLTRPRAVLTKMVLISQRRIDVTELEDLTPERTEVGYQLGRLLAVLENIQRSALGEVNTTIVDRFYGSLSTTPATVFSRLMANTQSHLGKIRKDNTGAFIASDKRLQDILSRLNTIPSTLPLEEQALFGLGYYHERARRFADIEAAKAAKKGEAQ